MKIKLTSQNKEPRIINILFAIFLITAISFLVRAHIIISENGFNQVYNKPVEYKTDVLNYTNYCGAAGVTYNGKKLK